MGPSTFSFMLRWFLAEFLSAFAAAIFGAYGFLTWTPDPVDSPFSTVNGLAGRPLSLAALLIGIFGLWNTWQKAAASRTGRPAPGNQMAFVAVGMAALGCVLWATGLLEPLWLILQYGM